MFIACGFRAADGVGEFRAIVEDERWIDIAGIMHWLDDEGRCWLAPLRAKLHFPDDQLDHYQLQLGRRLEDGSLERLTESKPADHDRERQRRGPRTKPTIAWFDLHPIADEDWYFKYSRTRVRDRNSDFEFSLEALQRIAWLARRLLSHGGDWRTASELDKLRGDLSCQLEGPMRSSNHDLLRAADGTGRFDIRGSENDSQIRGSMFCLASGLAYFEIDLRIEDDCLVHWSLRYQPHPCPPTAWEELELLRHEAPHAFAGGWVVNAENDVPLYYRRPLGSWRLA